MSSIIHYGPLPATLLTKPQLQEIVFDSILQHGDSFQMANLLYSVTSKVKSIVGAFNIPTGTTYTEGLNQADIGRVREILWDFIILRYLTPGDFHNDGWPYLSVTETGKSFFVR